jgi:pyruvate-formate lyase
MAEAATIQEQVRDFAGLVASTSRLFGGKVLGKQGMLLRGFLGFVAGRFNTTPALREEMRGTQGWINLTVGFRSDDGVVAMAIRFRDGRVSVLETVPDDVDCVFIFASSRDIARQIEASPDEAYKMILRGAIRSEGNFMLLGLFGYYVNLVLGREQQKAVDRQIAEHRRENRAVGEGVDVESCRHELPRRKVQRLKGDRVDPGVKYLEDPHLSAWGLEDFPRLKRFHQEYFGRAKEAVVCPEYGKLLTDFHLEHGYETDADCRPWEPNLRKALSLRYVLEHRRPVIRKGDLVAGILTTDPVSGCVGHPFAVGCYSWGELRSFRQRELMPYEITDEAIEILHKHVFPYWVRRNMHELWRAQSGNGLPVRIHDRMFAIYYWKTVSMSEVTPGHDKTVKLGTRGLIHKIEAELARDSGADEEKKATLRAMTIALEGVEAYARNLAGQARREALAEPDPVRRAELEEMHRALSKVPANPAETLHEAVQAIALVDVCLGLESTDDGPMFGRLDQILQPYFEADMSRLTTPAEREAYVKRVIEIIGCLFFKEASHQIVTPDLGNWQNSGSAPNGTITLGGVTPDGRDAVNDMSYVILKVTELLGLNNPNMHVRFSPGVNSRAFLKRACEVNYVTGATPCIHGDNAMIAALSTHGWALEDVRNWVATGCVEPSLPGCHASATSSLELNLVAPLEMAMNNGRHPLMNWDLGPKTGVIENGDFATFESFWEAFEAQCSFLVEQAVIGNNQLGEVYQRHQPAPLLSALLDGCVESGRGVTRGGAKYNSTGVSVIGLADVVDSLLVIQKLVFEDARVSFADLHRAVRDNFVHSAKLHALVKTAARRFGSGDDVAVAMANRVTAMVKKLFAQYLNYRGGLYAVGWWSMANHAAYGRVTGALPSGRLAGEPFTPGLTPHPSASPNLLDNLRDVARLEPRNLDNNIAFNVKIVPGPTDTKEKAVDIMTTYAKTFFELGGMQVQYNVVTTDLLRDAMAHPEPYSDLMVRISGYVAYFTKLQRDLQLEVIRRAEYRI